MRTEGTSHPDRRKCRICRKLPQTDWESGPHVRLKRIDGGRREAGGGWGGDGIDGGRVEISVLGGESVFSGPSHSQRDIQSLRN